MSKKYLIFGKIITLFWIVFLLLINIGLSNDYHLPLFNILYIISLVLCLLTLYFAFKTKTKLIYLYFSLTSIMWLFANMLYYDACSFFDEKIMWFIFSFLVFLSILGLIFSSPLSNYFKKKKSVVTKHDKRNIITNIIVGSAIISFATSILFKDVKDSKRIVLGLALYMLVYFILQLILISAIKVVGEQ